MQFARRLNLAPLVLIDLVESRSLQFAGSHHLDGHFNDVRLDGITWLLEGLNSGGGRRDTALSHLLGKNLPLEEQGYRDFSLRKCKGWSGSLLICQVKIFLAQEGHRLLLSCRSSIEDLGDIVCFRANLRHR